MEYSTHLIILLLLLSLAACRQPTSEELPLAVQGYPIDSTLQILNELPSIVDESSGIINWEGNLWTHNDSKKQAAIFEVNPRDGKLLRTVQIPKSENTDWEELAQDSQYIYIGDFGNNHGTRKDLKIYKVAKRHILEKGIVEQVETITFSYPDQADFKGPTHGHNYDCEAMIALGDSLYLFSKNFQDLHSRLYSLPKTPGTYVAQLKDRFDVAGQITGADINQEDKVVALTGYYYDKGTFLPFVWLFWEYPESSFFRGKKQRVNLPVRAQVEGICYDQNGYFFISSESSSFVKGQLYRLNARRWMK